jgi:DNA modification methylase
MEITINKQFRTLFRPLTDEEFSQLEANLLQDGIRDPLVLWGDVLIDGHNRYAIAQKHNLKFKTIRKEFKDKTETEIWIRSNQKGRRNFTKLEQLYNIGKLYELTKKKQGGDHKSKGHNDQLKNTAIDLSEKYGVGEKTIRRAADFVKEVDIIGEINPDIKDKLLSGTIRATQKNIKILANMEPTKRLKIIKTLEALPIFSQAKKLVEIEMSKGLKENQIIEDTKRKPPLIYQMDCVDFINSCKPYDLLLTDPPYSTDVKDIDAFVNRWLYPALDKLKPTGVAYICIGAYPQELQAYFTATIPEHIVLKQVLVWNYKNVPMVKVKGYRQTYCNILVYCGKESSINVDDPTEGWAVFDDPKPDPRWGTWYHGWQKPMSLAEKFIRHSTQKGDLVVDPFIGTGTFVLAASKLGRNGVGADISTENLYIAKNRGCQIIR